MIINIFFWKNYRIWQCISRRRFIYCWLRNCLFYDRRCDSNISWCTSRNLGWSCLIYRYLNRSWNYSRRSVCWYLSWSRGISCGGRRWICLLLWRSWSIWSYVWRSIFGNLSRSSSLCLICWNLCRYWCCNCSRISWYNGWLICGCLRWSSWWLCRWLIS